MSRLQRPFALFAFFALICAAPYAAEALNEHGAFIGLTIFVFIGMLLLAGMVGAYGTRK